MSKRAQRVNSLFLEDTIGQFDEKHGETKGYDSVGVSSGQKASAAGEHKLNF